MKQRIDFTARLEKRGASAPSPPVTTGARSRRWRRIALGAVAALLFLALLPFAWLALQYQRTPMSALSRPLTNVRVAREVCSRAVTSSGERRLFRDITLAINHNDSLRIAVSVPEPCTSQLPVLLILGGLDKGRAALDYLPTHGRNVLIGYDYPYDESLWYENAKVLEVARVRRAVLSVPSQVVAVLQWVQTQPWADAERLSLLGYSFGTLFIPATQRLAQENDLKLLSTVMAYGGADIQLLLERNLRLQPDWLRDLLARVLATSIRPLEPEIHLPHLRGSFLLINGNADEKIPYSAAVRMHQLTPEPKTVVELEAAHLHPRRQELTAQIIDISERWLVERGAVNPLKARRTFGERIE